MKWFSVAGWVLGATTLVAIFYPAFVPARQGCHKCLMSLTTIKQLGLAAIIYAMDHDERLFPAESWNDSVMPYMLNRDLLSDPVRSTPYQSLRSVEFGFAFFRPLDKTHLPEVEDPNRVPLFFPSEIRKRNATSGLGTLPVVPRLQEGHAIAFADGSARYVLPEKLADSVKLTGKP